MDFELAIPHGFGFENGLPSFIRGEGLYAKSIDLIKNRIRLAY